MLSPKEQAEVTCRYCGVMFCGESCDKAVRAKLERDLAGANALISAIERLIPDWENYRDLAEAVQSKLETLKWYQSLNGVFGENTDNYDRTP